MQENSSTQEISRKVKILAIIALAILIVASIARKYEETRISNTISPGISQPVPSSPTDVDSAILLPDAPKIAEPQPVKPAPVIAPKPLISAEAYLVGNLETGEVYIEHNSKTVFPIASLTKLVTSLIALHTMKPDQKIIITQPMLDAYGDAGHLVLGETLTVSELLSPLLLESSNDAAEAIAQSYGYAQFIAEMNGFVGEIGMNQTSFRDSSGLTSHNVSDAVDLFTLARYIYANEKPLLDITKTIQVTLATTTDHGSHVWNTINPFPYDPHFIGGKTGRTDEAKESMISMFKYDVASTTYPVAIIVLRSDFSQREFDSSALFEQFMAKYK